MTPRKSDKSLADPAEGVIAANDALAGYVEEPPPAPLDGFIRCYNAEIDGTADLPIQALGIYRGKGWVPVAEEVAPAPEAVVATAVVAPVEAPEVPEVSK